MLLLRTHYRNIKLLINVTHIYHIKKRFYEHIYHLITLGIEFLYFFLNIDVNNNET